MPIRLQRAWPVLALSAPALAGYWWYSSREQTFDLPVRVRGPDGKAKMSTRTLPLMSMQNVNARIREHANTHTVTRPGITWHHSTACVAANDPIEDATAHQVIRRDEGDGDLLFFTVFDGHSGFYTSRLLSRVLINAVALELNALDSPKKADWLSGFKNTLWSTKPTKPDVDIHVNASYPNAPPAGDPLRVARAIQTAFTSLDAELLAAPVRVLASELKDTPKDSTAIPDLTKHPLALPAMLPAISGSCAILAMLDTAHRNLYVACTGDSRAVAGVWVPEPESEGKGTWRVEVLSEDQTGRNPSEVARMRSEHPADEAADVIRNGRVLGGLEPSRAFGDARYKWSRNLQETLSRAFLAGTEYVMSPPRSGFKTPPYVTARPVVTHRTLSLPGSESESESSPQQGTLRFLVLATDGLWDELDSADVVRLVGGHLAGLSGSVPKSKLSELVPTSSPSATLQGKGRAARQSREQEKGEWAFVDENPAAHLIRNAFGGADEGALRRLLSIPAPLARRHRDDVSVTVVWWEEGPNGEKTEIREVKAKL
ncbi:phophatase 2C family protein, partial [Roridomyces roridus]